MQDLGSSFDIFFVPDYFVAVWHCGVSDSARLGFVAGHATHWHWLKKYGLRVYVSELRCQVGNLDSVSDTSMSISVYTDSVRFQSRSQWKGDRTLHSAHPDPVESIETPSVAAIWRLSTVLSYRLFLQKQTQLRCFRAYGGSRV